MTLGQAFKFFELQNDKRHKKHSKAPPLPLALCCGYASSPVLASVSFDVQTGVSGALCPNHFFASNIGACMKWGRRCGLSLPISENAGLCNRCSPYLRDVATNSVLHPDKVSCDLESDVKKYYADVSFIEDASKLPDVIGGMGFGEFLSIGFRRRFVNTRTFDDFPYPTALPPHRSTRSTRCGKSTASWCRACPKSTPSSPPMSAKPSGTSRMRTIKARASSRYRRATGANVKGVSSTSQPVNLSRKYVA